LSLGSHGQREGDRGQQTFRNIGHNNADGENNVRPEGVFDYEPTQQEKSDAKEYGNIGDDLDEMPDFLLHMRDLDSDLPSGAGYPADLGIIPGGDDNRFARS